MLRKMKNGKAGGKGKITAELLKADMNTTEKCSLRIIRQHEREVVKMLRGLEKTTRKLACWKNHRHFNTRCLHDNVIPKSLHIRSTVKGIKASTILRKAEKKLLNIRISQCHFTVNKLQDEKELLEANLRTKLTETEMEEVTAFIEHAHETTFRETRERQQRKYDQLLSKQQHGADSPQLDDPDNITERWVINLANRHLDSDEVSLLKKGLNFAVTPQNLPIDDLITTTELACKNIKEKHRADGLRCEVAKAVMKHKAKKRDLTYHWKRGKHFKLYVATRRSRFYQQTRVEQL